MTMDSTRFTRDDDLYASVHLYLAKQCAGIRSARCAGLVVTAALHTIHCAIADFNESWNADSLSLLPSLPNELLIACFERLQACDRLTASRVSRGWRALLLSTPTFWTHIYRPSKMADAVAVCRLQNMIQRSGTVLIDVDWLFGSDAGIEDAYLRRIALDELSASMPRIRSLSIQGDDMDLILNAPAPCLQSLELSGRARGGRIPASWICREAPMLTTLSIAWLPLPAEFLPLRNIATFTGAFLSRSAHGVSTRALFELFPCLKSLTLYGINDATELPGFAPPSLSRIVLSGDDVAYDEVLANWTRYPPRTPRSFSLESEGPVPLRAAVQHLTSVQLSSSASISIRCDSTYITLSTPDSYEIQLNELHHMSRVYECWAGLAGTPCLAAIRSLSITASMLMPVLRADLELPGLTDIAIVTVEAYRGSEMRLAVTSDAPGPRVPQLRTVTFEAVERPLVPLPSHSRIKAYLAALTDFVAKYLRPDSRSLESLTIIQSLRPRWESVSSLLAYSDKLYYCTTPGAEHQEMLPPHNPQGEPDAWDEEVLNGLAALSH
ncbi:hypothetical protein AURDEDRAFT_188281 [Auricularia subglabra TFB-10046 SS5]|nr:hypothetical protein AURDEDRAFT_188281 [Auricularia subglabra TFB-10046 SS5]